MSRMELHTEFQKFLATIDKRPEGIPLVYQRDLFDIWEMLEGEGMYTPVIALAMRVTWRAGRLFGLREDGTR